jgi:23S rRNA (cytidine1920-2'-O)/16S rRNA (cytidine1409-2'-O)-methyltransferase
VGKKGVVKDPAVHKKVLQEMVEFCREMGLDVVGTCESPLLGSVGNREFFIYAVKE